MIDFKNPSFMKLSASDPAEAYALVSMMLIDSETIFAAFKTVRDQVIFTNRRIIAVNVQAITGKKKEFTSLPYSKIHAFSVETAGVIDLDAEMELWFSEIGTVRFAPTAVRAVSIRTGRC